MIDRLQLRPAGPARVPAPLAGPDDVVRRQRVRQRRPRIRRPGPHRLEGGPGLRPRRAGGAAGDLPPGRRNLGRPAAAAPRDGDSNLISGASQGLIALLLLLGHAQIWQLMALAAVNGMSSAFFFPASSGIIPQTVPRPMLQRRTRSFASARTAAGSCGAALGGLVVAATSPARDRGRRGHVLPRCVLHGMHPASEPAAMETSNFFAELPTAGGSSARARGCG